MVGGATEARRGSLSDLSLACLSDTELRTYAERELAGSVKPELLHLLDRSNIVKLLLAHSANEHHHRSAAPLQSSGTATAQEPQVQTALAAQAAPSIDWARPQCDATAATAASSLGSIDAYTTDVAAMRHTEALSDSSTRIITGVSTGKCSQASGEQAAKTLKRPTSAAFDGAVGSTSDVRSSLGPACASSPSVDAEAQLEKKAVAKSLARRDLLAYMTREPVEHSLARKCQAPASGMSVPAAERKVPCVSRKAGETHKAMPEEDCVPPVAEKDAPTPSCKKERGPKQSDQPTVESFAKRVRCSKVGRPRKNSKDGEGARDTVGRVDAIAKKDKKLMLRLHPDKRTPEAVHGLQDTEQNGDVHMDEVKAEVSGPAAAVANCRSASKPRLVCHIDPANRSEASLCAVLSNLTISDSSQGHGAKLTDVSPGDLILACAGAHPKWELDAHLSRWLRERLRPAEIKVPATWALKPHQEDGYRWLISRAASRLGCILADDMGLGKTRQAIAWLLGVRLSLEEAPNRAPSVDNGQQLKQQFRSLTSQLGNSVDPHLGQSCPSSPFQCAWACSSAGCGQANCTPVKWERALVLAPSMLVRGEDSVWVKEFREVIEQWKLHHVLRIWQWHGERSGELRSIAYTSQWSGPLVELYDVVIVSYESFLMHHEEFIKESWTCVVLDEAQSIKNHGAQIAAATKKLANVPFRLAMTGSPIENCLEDFHSILEFVQPDCAGTVQDFRSRFPSNEGGRAALRRLSQLLVLRRESGVAIRMVPREELEIAVQMKDVQRCLSEKLIEQGGLTSFKRLKDLELLCTHPWCYGQRASAEMQKAMPERFLGAASEQDIGDSSKLEELFSILRGLLSQGQKVLIFFCRVITSELVAALIQKAFGIEPGIIRGDTTSGERERMIREFKADPDSGSRHSQVLLLSVWIGALGLNLPEARWVVHIERVWNPALERQATSRVHRITSQLPVKAYCLFTEGSVEERKRAVLLHKRGLSSHIFEVLDGDHEEDDDAVLANMDLSELISGVTKPEANPGEDVEALGDVDGEDMEHMDSDPDCSKCEDEKGPAYPLHGSLKPNMMKEPVKGKYGDPSDKQQWQWYAVEGRKEVHPRATQSTTAGIMKSSPNKSHTTTIAASPLSSRPCRLHDPRERNDWQVLLHINDVPCRLFIPDCQRHHFQGDADCLRLCPTHKGSAPFPIFMPSFGRSATDVEAGLLDLTQTMLTSDGKPLDFVQIVAVKPSEVEKYRASAPFFVVMELPGSHTVEHPSYGRLKPNELGVGCARHWLVLLADILGADHIFMLDDSVRFWHGVTLVKDSHNLFGPAPGPKAQFTRIALGQVLQSFASPHFPTEEFEKFSMIGFARMCPEMYLAARPHRRAHVYSAFILNVKKVFREQRLNFREDLFIWEDVEFTQRVHNVCKSFRFTMVKKPYNSGGCSSCIARSENPIVRAVVKEEKLSADQIAAEAMHESSLGISARGSVQQQAAAKRGPKRKHMRVKRKAGAVEEQETREPDGPSAAELAGRSQFELESDPALQNEGAVCNSDGYLLRKYYTRFIQAFKDKERSRADPAAPTGRERPGMRSGEEIPEGVRMWDDTRGRKKHTKGDQWGAGWIAYHPYKSGTEKGKAMWFNVRVWGSWRLAFCLARLQRATWIARCPRPVDSAAASSTDGAAASSAGPVAKTPMKRGRRPPTTQRAGDEAEHSEKKRSKSKDPQSTLLSFFESKPVVKVEPVSQPTILNFFGKQKVASESS